MCRAAIIRFFLVTLVVLPPAVMGNEESCSAGLFEQLPTFQVWAERTRGSFTLETRSSHPDPLATQPSSPTCIVSFCEPGFYRMKSFVSETKKGGGIAHPNQPYLAACYSADGQLVATYDEVVCPATFDSKVSKLVMVLGSSQRGQESARLRLALHRGSEEPIVRQLRGNRFSIEATPPKCPDMNCWPHYALPAEGFPMRCVDYEFPNQASVMDLVWEFALPFLGLLIILLLLVVAVMLKCGSRGPRGPRKRRPV